MSIKVTFEFETAEDAADFILGRGTNFVEASPTAAPAGDKPRRGRPPKVAAPVDPTPAAGAIDASVATPAATAAPATAPAASTAAAAPVNAVPFAALVEPLTALADKDLDAAMAILAKYGVKKASELKPAQFGEVLAAVNAALVPTKTSLI